MNILVVSSMAWDDTNSIGNTLSNWFDGDTWKDDNFYHLYLRKQPPNNTVCRNYFQISVFDIINPFIHKEKIGKQFKINCEKKNKYQNSKKEKKLIGLLHKVPLNAIYGLIDFAYQSKRWINKSLDAYILESHIDIVFVVVTDVSFMASFIKHIRNNYQKRIIIYIPDDMKGRYENTGAFRKDKLLSELRFIIENADYAYCASEKLSSYYCKYYGREFNTIYKGCVIKKNVVTNMNNPLKIIYAGSLFYGRNTVLLSLISALKEINRKKNNSFCLDIYSADDLLKTDEDIYNVAGVSRFVGKLPYEQVCSETRNSDFVLIPESFLEKDKIQTRYSFSTKIPEGLQSGVNLLAIGPSDISSMEFLSKLPFVYYINENNKIISVLEDILNDRDTLLAKRCESLKYAIKMFDIHQNQHRIRKAFIGVLEGENNGKD